MSDSQTPQAGDLTGFLLQQNKLQQHLIDAQQQIIELYQRLEERIPAEPKDDVSFHLIAREGMSSEDVFAGDNLEDLRQLREWIFQFGEKYVKPYVHLRVYGEIVGHMSRGLAQKLAELEVQHELGLFPPEPPAAKKATKKIEPRSKPLYPKDE